MKIDEFYRAFEDAHRGSRELIKSRLEVYIPFAIKINELENNLLAIDLGCGRGEWLELIEENGFKAKGVDLDEFMLKECEKNGLDATKKDALEFIREFENESVNIVSGFHIAEHLPFNILQELIEESYRVLKPGGLLILETPNPENIRVATEYFYSDPTHIKPIPSNLLSFLVDFCGFERVKVLKLQESKSISMQEYVDLVNVINDVSPDYSVLAQKKAEQQVMNHFDELFNKEYGLSLDTLISKFQNKFNIIDEKINNTNKSIKDNQLDLEKLKNSIFWKLINLLERIKRVIKK